MLDLNSLDTGVPKPHPLLARGVMAATRLIRWVPPGTDFVLEDFEKPAEPVIFAMNHTHKYDFLPIRTTLFERGMHLASWIKLRAYQDPAMRWFLSLAGNVPLGSRGYVIGADFKQLLGRVPTDQEYRALRAHVDEEAPLPDEAIYARLTSEPRELLGLPFSPSQTSYRQAALDVYAHMMEISLRLGRLGIAEGVHMHLYPEGRRSSRLSRGHIGIVQVAMALDLPIVPVGQSGCLEAFAGQSARLGGGRVTLRFGELMRLDTDGLPDDFEPFNPTDEQAHRAQLQRLSDQVVDAINPLLDLDYQWADGQSDGVVGVARFIK